MVDMLIMAGLGVCLGLLIGFVLGVESPRRCESCRANTGSRYMAGFRAGAQTGRKDGYCDGVADAVELVRERADASVQAWNGEETWNIEKRELERIREDLVETAYV